MQQITDVKAKELVAGVAGHYVHGDFATFGYVTLKAGSVVPDHSHVNEQITYILEGQLRMTIGDEDCLLEPGAVHVIPSNVVHNATAITDCKLIDVFGPVRHEYK